MFLLVLALLSFGAVHLIPAVPRFKTAAQMRFGRLFGPIYGLVSLLAFIAAIWAFRSSESTVVYDPPTWGRHANFALTFLAFLALGIFAFRGHLRNRLRYPMTIAVLLWATGHLLANGDTRSLVFFGGFAVISLLHVFAASRLVTWTPTPVRQGHDALALFFGTAFYGVFVQIHGVVAGVPVLDLIRATP